MGLGNVFGGDSLVWIILIFCLCPGICGGGCNGGGGIIGGDNSILLILILLCCCCGSDCHKPMPIGGGCC